MSKGKGTWIDLTDAGTAESSIDSYISKAISRYDATKGPSAATLIDPNRDLGFDLMQRQFAMRTKAVLKPADYQTDRDRAFDAVKREVGKKFNESFTNFIGAGVPRQMAEQYALNAAADEKRHLAQLFELQFPSTNDAAFAVGMSHQNASHFPGAVRDPAAVATIAAPRRRAAAAPRRKRRATRK